MDSLHERSFFFWVLGISILAIASILLLNGFDPSLFMQNSSHLELYFMNWPLAVLLEKGSEFIYLGMILLTIYVLRLPFL